jgi:hypothetical protein
VISADVVLYYPHATIANEMIVWIYLSHLKGRLSTDKFWHLFALFPPAGRGAFISQLRVWPFSSSIVAALGERSQNPSSHLAGGKGILGRISLLHKVVISSLIIRVLIP